MWLVTFGYEHDLVFWCIFRLAAEFRGSRLLRFDLFDLYDGLFCGCLALAVFGEFRNLSRELLNCLLESTDGLR